MNIFRLKKSEPPVDPKGSKKGAQILSVHKVSRKVSGSIWQHGNSRFVTSRAQDTQVSCGIKGGRELFDVDIIE